jgi:excisionase family DNA binding protein
MTTFAVSKAQSADNFLPPAEVQAWRVALDNDFNPLSGNKPGDVKKFIEVTTQVLHTAATPEAQDGSVGNQLLDVLQQALVRQLDRAVNNGDAEFAKAVIGVVANSNQPDLMASFAVDLNRVYRTASGIAADKKVFTTGEAAPVCKISQQTIIRCFDSGRIGGYRVPGSKFRRIPRADLLKFMQQNKIPTDALTMAGVIKTAAEQSGVAVFADAVRGEETILSTADLLSQRMRAR